MWVCPDCGRSFKRTNQSHYCGAAPATIDEYIARQPQDLQPALMALRNAIHQAIPEAEETISWSTPTWKRKRCVIRLAVNRNDIGVYVEQDTIAHFEKALQGIETGRGVIHLKRNQEMPLSLIAEIAKWSDSEPSIEDGPIRS